MKIKLTHYQIKALLEMCESSGDPECCDDLVLQIGDNRAHSGPGLYAYWSECPEEGALFIGKGEADQACADALADSREAELEASGQEGFSAVDMATAAASGFRDGEAAARRAAAGQEEA